MTAELAILNKSGIVLASDSASTIGDNKVYNSAKKLFTLNPQQSIGIMVYGNAEFSDIPWEIIISKYRNKIKDECFATVKEYSEDFITFIKESDFLCSEEMSDHYVTMYSTALIQYVFQSIESSINSLLGEGQGISEQTLISLLTSSMSNIENGLTSTFIVDLDYDEFTERYSDIIHRVLWSISNYENVSRNIFTAVLDFIYYTIIRDNNFIPYTGIVLAGYGSSELFPSLCSYNLYSFIMGKLKYSEYENSSIGIEANTVRSTIVPFAQDDMVNTVVRGVDPQLSQFLAERANDFDAEGERIYTKIVEDLSVIQKEYYIEPLLNMIALLPVEETAVIAETLLNLTSFKRKYTASLETVGGPIDILAITPGEGPIWIQRKHYFDLEHNLGYRIRRESI